MGLVRVIIALESLGGSQQLHNQPFVFKEEKNGPTVEN